MPAKLVPDHDRGAGIHHAPDAVMPATPPPVMPVKTGIHLLHAEHWIPAFAGMTAGERYESLDAARREAVRLAADVEDLAVLEQGERALEDKRRGKKK